MVYIEKEKRVWRFYTPFQNLVDIFLEFKISHFYLKMPSSSAAAAAAFLFFKHTFYINFPRFMFNLCEKKNSTNYITTRAQLHFIFTPANSTNNQRQPKRETEEVFVLFSTKMSMGDHELERTIKLY